MKEVEIKHLKEQDIYGENSLCFINDNLKAKVSDYAILKGAAISNNYLIVRSDKGYGMYWIDSIKELDCAKIIEINGNKNNEDIYNRIVGQRPVFNYNEILPFISDTKKTGCNNFITVKFGNYPKNVVCNYLENELESLYNSGRLKKEDFSYTTDSRRYTEYYNRFCPYEDNVYSYKGKYYARVKANSCYEEFTLSNNKKYNNNSYIWIEVAPIKGLVDLDKGLVLCEDIIIAGIRYKDSKMFMDDYLKNEILYSNVNKNLSWKNDLTSDVETKKKYIESSEVTTKVKKLIAND